MKEHFVYWQEEHPNVASCWYYDDVMRLLENPSHHDLQFLHYCVSEYHFNPFTGKMLQSEQILVNPFTGHTTNNITPVGTIPIPIPTPTPKQKQFRKKR